MLRRYTFLIVCTKSPLRRAEGILSEYQHANLSGNSNKM